MMWLGLEKQEKVNIRQKTVARISGRMGFKETAVTQNTFPSFGAGDVKHQMILDM